MAALLLSTAFAASVMTHVLLVQPPARAADAAPAAAPATVEKVIRANRIELVDPTGKKLVGLAALADGSAGMSVYDPSGRQRVSISIGPKGQPQVVLFDDSGEPRAGMRIDETTHQGLILADRGNAAAPVPQAPAPVAKPQGNSAKPAKEQWAKLKLGMSAAEVERILGKPGKTTSISQQGQLVNIWYYPDILGGFAGFGNGRLVRWRDSDGNETRE
jgi:hypothetical protein